MAYRKIKEKWVNKTGDVIYLQGTFGYSNDEWENLRASDNLFNQQCSLINSGYKRDINA